MRIVRGAKLLAPIATLAAAAISLVAACGSSEELPVPTATPVPTVTHVRTGAEPSGLAFDGEHLWIANAADNTVTRMRRDGGVLGIFDVGERPVAVAYGGGYIWVANRGSNTVSQLTLGGDVVRSAPVGAEPVALAYFSDAMWVASYAEGTVSRISLDGDVSRGALVGFHPTDLAVAEENLWVANEGDASLTVLDASGRPYGTVPVFSGPSPGTFPDVSGPNGLLFDGEALWVAFPPDNTVTRMGRDGSFLASVEVTGEPRRMTLRNGELWVSTRQGTVVRIDPGGEIVGAVGVGQGAESIVTDGESIWVAMPTQNSLARIDP